MLSKAEKQKVVDDLASRFQSVSSMFVVEYQGLKVNEMDVLRKKLRQTNTEFRVVKNTLLEKASLGTDIEKMKDLFSGPTAIAICDGESSAVAKVFVDYSEDFPEIRIKGGIFEGEVVDISRIEQIAKLPSRQELISEFVGLLSAPMGNLVGVLEQARSNIVNVLEGLKEKKTK
ncbi:MAG: 50S ribosomal protein L10 [Candidatus Dadabacteria bacterium]|nr:50S ribosomal protein L10 [Candidatus Dadabacteria bacterium]